MIKDPSRAALLAFALSATACSGVAEPTRACASMVIGGAAAVAGAHGKQSILRDADDLADAALGNAVKAVAAAAAFKAEGIPPKSFFGRAADFMGGAPNDPKGEWNKCMMAPGGNEGVCQPHLLPPEEIAKNRAAAELFVEVLKEESGFNDHDSCLNALGFDPEP